MFCNNCHSEIPNDAAFCPICGAPVQAQARQTTYAQNNDAGTYAPQNEAGWTNAYGGNYASNMNYVPPEAVEKPTLTNCYNKFWKNYANFSGRSRRSEYWFVVLTNFLIAFINVIPYVGTGVYSLYTLAVIVPMLALIVRRLHDIGREWYYIFFGLIPIAGFIILIVWMCQDSQPGSNKFGPNPKGVN